MSRHNEPPRAVGQISQNKGRIFDLERRLAPRPVVTESECCGETKMYRWRPMIHRSGPDGDGQNWWTDPISLPVNGSPFQRMKITATVEIESESILGWRVVVGHLGVSTVEMNGTMHSFNAEDVYMIHPSGLPFITQLRADLMVDYPTGIWGIFIGGEGYFATVDTTTGNTSRTDEAPWFRSATIEVIEGQVLNEQDYWPEYIGPL